MKIKYRYPAIFDYNEDGISVKFPDSPSCLTCGTTKKETIRNAREALSLHLYGIEQDGDEIPSPTPTSKITLQQNQSIELIEAYKL